jgi:hypothetical protein
MTKESHAGEAWLVENENVLSETGINGTPNLRGGSGNLHRWDEWSFCLTAARMAAEQERR